MTANLVIRIHDMRTVYYFKILTLSNNKKDKTQIIFFLNISFNYSELNDHISNLDFRNLFIFKFIEFIFTA